MQAVIFKIVAAKMLETYTDSLFLHARNICLCHRACEIGILREVLEIAPVAGIALDIDAGRKQEFYAAVTAIVCKALAHRLRALRIPCIGKHFNGRICHRGNGKGISVLPLAFGTQPHGPVRHRDEGKFSVQIVRVPEIFSVKQADFLLRRESSLFLFHVFSPLRSFFE